MSTQTITNLLDQVRDEARVQRRKAAETLRELLLRADSPEKGDRENLVELMEVLSLQLDDLQPLADAAQQLVETEQIAATQERLSEEKRSASRGMTAVDQWGKSELLRITKEAEVKRSVHSRAFSNADQAIREIRAAKNAAFVSRRLWLELSAGVDSETAANMLRQQAADDASDSGA